MCELLKEKINYLVFKRSDLNELQILCDFFVTKHNRFFRQNGTNQVFV